MYKFNKIRYKKTNKLLPGEKHIYLDGNLEDFETVKNKYIWLANNTNYPNTKYKENTRELYDKIKYFLKEKKPTSVLDVGCGRGSFCEILTNYCNNVHGLDFAINPDKKFCDKGINFIKSNAHTMPLPDKSIEILTSFDFLEHVHPDYLEKTIKEMFRVCSKYMIHKIARAPSSSNFKHVGQLHLIQEYINWWVDQVFNPSTNPNVKSVEKIGSGTLLINVKV